MIDNTAKTSCWPQPYRRFQTSRITIGGHATKYFSTSSKELPRIDQLGRDTEETLQLRLFILLHILVTAAGAVTLWWFVFRDSPGEALADGISAGAIAGYAEIMLIRLTT